MDWSNCKCGQVSGSDTSGEPLVSIPLSFVLDNVGLNSFSVECEVQSDRFCEFCRIEENGSPLTKCCDVISHAKTSVEGLRDLKSDNSEFKNGLSSVIPAIFVEF